MYCLNKRQTEIITDLLQRNEYIPAKEIADKFKVSVRTIRYDLEIIEYWLNENKSTLVKIPNKGILIKTKMDRILLSEKLKFLSVENRVLSEKERVNYIIIEMLSEEKPLVVEELSKRLLLSRNTTMKVIKRVEDYLKGFDLALDKQYGKGLIICGNEINKRNILVEIFIEIFDVHNIVLAMNNIDAYNELMIFCQNTYNYFHFDNIMNIYKIIKEIENKYNYYLTDMEFGKLIVYLVITINRISNNQFITNKVFNNYHDQDYIIGSILAKRLSDQFSIQFSIEEIDELTSRVRESKSFNSLNDLKLINIETDFNEEVIDITKYIISYAERELNVSLRNDRELLKGLALHIKTALARIKNKKQIKNEYTNEITRRFPLVFQIVKESLNSMEHSYVFEDEEVAYITLHIRSAYERNYRENYMLTALVVCAEGLSFLNLLITNLKMNFPDLKVIETCSIYDYNKYKKEIDFVITTDKVKINDVDVVKISPFIDDNDIYKISQTLIKLNKFKQIYRYNKSKRRKGGRSILLEDILNTDMIELGVNAKDWEEAISKAARPLVEKDKVEQAYVDNMIQAVKDLGPYIVIMPGIAFAHARPDNTVKHTCMSMITLKEPVKFGSEQNDPVSVVFAFAAENGDDHLKALQDLAKFLAIEENVEFLKKEVDKDIVLKKILND